MLEAVVNFGEKIGITGLDFRLTRDSWGKIWRVSFLPFVLLCVMLTNLIAELEVGYPSSASSASEEWRRIYAASDSLSTLLSYVCLPTLVLFGIRRWSRSEASWMFLIGLTLIAAAAVCTLASTAIRALLIDPRDQFDLHLTTWTRWALEFAIVAVGYLFIAYRGLANVQPANRAAAEPDEPAQH